ncbi:MAG: hypothetical protein ACK5Q5_12450 [Planctomycetaceae bacterium]
MMLQRLAHWTWSTPLACRAAEGGLGNTIAKRGAIAMLFLGLVTSAASAQFGGQRLEISRQQLVGWVFNSHGSVDAARKHLHEELEGQIALIEVIGTLTSEQRQRLTLAGEGDIHRFFTEAQRVIDRQPVGQVDQDQWNKIWQRVSPIREQFNRGLTGENSLFQKTIRTALTPEQWNQYESLMAEREQRNYRLLVAAAIAELEIKVPLTRKQRTALIELVATQTKPPRVRPAPHLQYIFVMYRMSELSQKDLRRIFEEPEFQVVKQILEHAQNFRGQFDVEQRGAIGGVLNFLF